MELINLKQEILKKELTSNFYIFVYEDTDFVCKQYAKEISKILNLEIKYVDELEINKGMFEVVDDEYLYIYVEDELNIILKEPLRNTIIISKHINQEIQNNLKQYIVMFNKLEKWHIKEYVKNSCVGLEEKQINWLTEHITNIDDLENEISKIDIFNKYSQKGIMLELFNSNNYFKETNDLFKISNFILSPSLDKIDNVIINYNFETFSFIGLVRKNLKLLLSIQLDKSITYQELNISYKQYLALKYQVGKRTSKQLLNMLKFANTIDYQIKQGYLDLNKESLNKYIVFNLLEME